MKIEIEMPNKKAVENFTKWFNKEGFDLFTKSKFNKLEVYNTDSFITCLATLENLSMGGEFAGKFIELQ
jgi:hypothetical protein